ncbi:hypothetical protein PMG11_04839 [Penicillium brasilianum]|uniref:Rhodopsin domain-containing protein n=1 Tax=Penicillium brasilianum TaxID=104259 RepID=A0A0F7VGX8_PENBI|nr:hypothetical protein PMG11_04839 [Penicillium brasilianum]
MRLSRTFSQRENWDTPIDRSVQTWNYVCQSLCIFGMCAFFGIRLYTRLFMVRGFEKEDWACSIAWFLGVSYSVISIIMGYYGGGLHYVDVPVEDHVPFYKTVYVTMVMYGPTAYVTKVCLLWVMTRVFSPVHNVVILIYIFLGIMLAYYIPVLVVKIRICNPIARFWDTDIDGTCLDQRSIILADAVISMASDFVILILPLLLTMHLQMSTKKKIRVAAVLGAGGFAVLASIIRLVLIIVTGQSKDITLAFMRINMLGNAEISIGVICTCLPAFLTFVRHFDHESQSSRATRTSEQRIRVETRSAEPVEDTWIYIAQGSSTIRTTIRRDTNASEVSGALPPDSTSITRTVGILTHVESQ